MRERANSSNVKFSYRVGDTVSGKNCAIEGRKFLIDSEFLPDNGEVLYSEDDYAFLYVENDEVLGVMVFSEFENPSYFWISLGYVKPEHRERGIYNLLWKAIAERAKSQNVPTISGATNVKNIVMQEVYKRQGRVAETITYSYKS